MSAGGGAADADEKTRGLLRAALARGRAGAAPRLMREHCLAPERRPGGIVVQRLMLAPEAHAVAQRGDRVVLAVVRDALVAQRRKPQAIERVDLGLLDRRAPREAERRREEACDRALLAQIRAAAVVVS